MISLFFFIMLLFLIVLATINNSKIQKNQDLSTKQYQILKKFSDV